MKTQILLLVAFFFMMNKSFATVRTVSNDGAGGSQYGDLLSAYNAASDGDTLMLEGTNVPYSIYTGNYPANYWNKSLTVIGIGYNPTKELPRRSKITHNAYYGDAYYFTAGASGSKFYGIEFVSNLRMSNSINNMLFEDCKFDNTFQFNNQNCAGFAFLNCIFDNDNNVCISMDGAGNAISNVQISNCVFDGYIEGNGNQNTSFIYDHCMFLGTNYCFNSVWNSLVKNCVFMNVLPAGYSCSWLNNMSVPTGSYETLNGSTGSGNILNTNPNLTTYTMGTYWNPTQDYHLLSGSPAIGAANDGTEIGVHGGYSKFSETGEVLITPIVRSVSVNQTNAAPGNTINVHIVASKPNDQ